jgi:hypothetical protein
MAPFAWHRMMLSKEESMSNLHILAIDVAKRSFQV